MSGIEANWDHHRVDKSKIEKSYLEFEKNIISLLSTIEKGLKTQTFLYNYNGTENQDDELKTLVENNKELSHQKDKKLNETSLRMAQYENLKKGELYFDSSFFLAKYVAYVFPWTYEAVPLNFVPGFIVCNLCSNRLIIDL